MRKGELTRDRIIELAAPLFNQRGFAGCSMADIMEATGLEKGGLYRHFSSKEALAIEALKYSIAETKRTRTDTLGSAGSAVEKLLLFITHFVDLPSPVQGGCPLLNSAIDSDDGNESLRKVARSAFADWRRRIGAIVQDGKDAGQIGADVDPAELADTLIASLEGALVLSRLDNSKVPLRRVQRALRRIVADAATRDRNSTTK